ncbi:MAG: hypothetical protein M1371_06085 [Actinobacteria bacterium]|nr:hypothetical protein [Actinomycetota bacterium]
MQKYYTYFALFRVRQDFLAQVFPIKLEASVRPVDWKMDVDFKLLALSSKVTNLTVLAQVTSLERIEQEKLTIQPPRIRDIFDLWFVAQKLGKSTSMDFGNQDTEIVRRELFKFLPEKDKRLVEQWLQGK